ncbi:M23 family metallopeptidase [Phytomonospora endophytica]|uniref:Murein DD-endopeptidase MepM/ murein hydrolase activator NlpD n=1 Tax=Phytomonospora endophytica TaxID=714109 RepID=A0A841FS98_9ACTN|nr:M23 family metallopeptidase [Phytomonospora endophytica]MBB6037683.1 murein DD-endopeptidase MepM/ murein hydrolase activator NlpD [Phytomonospora endophytica]GIG67790.1 hypothetical protein Pen01_40850 [Phytomonospora endophytica]
MNGRLLGLGALCAPVVLVLGIAMAAAGSGAITPAPTSSAACIPTGTTVVEGVELSTEQWTNAATIIDVGIRDKNLAVRAAVIAVATAMQESTLHNYGHLGENNDHDSLGLFQQRPSAGWGTPEQILDPTYAAGKFYDKLVTIPGWESMPLTLAAQTVQVSAYPDAYAKWEPLATSVVTALTAGCAGSSGPISAAGWTSPVPGSPVCSGYRTPERPTHDGIDLCSPKGTPIRAAAAGVVVTMMCNASTPDGVPYSCDIDGSPSILGCGWYVEILHTDASVTRYCHMSRQPDVQVGQTVTPGQQIGLIGSSGNSSGPHLHLECHLAFPAYSSNATEPSGYFASRGITAW